MPVRVINAPNQATNDSLIVELPGQLGLKYTNLKHIDFISGSGGCLVGFRK